MQLMDSSEGRPCHRREVVGKHQRVPTQPTVAAACLVVAYSVLTMHAGGRLYGSGGGNTLWQPREAGKRCARLARG
jgi:hypothetical protein